MRQIRPAAILTGCCRIPEDQRAAMLADLQRALNVTRHLEQLSSQQLREHPGALESEAYLLWMQADGCLHSLRGLIEWLASGLPDMAALLESMRRIDEGRWRMACGHPAPGRRADT